jgi:hypothetical protein
MTIDPMWRFVIGLAVTTAIAISQGTLVLTHAIPPDWIPGVTAWCGIIAFVGSAATTTISGLGMTNNNRIASAAAATNVQKILTTAQVANGTQFAANDKVVSQIAPNV